MAQRPRLDLRRLARDAAATPDSRRKAGAPGGRPATGLMDIVRDHLDALVALQAGGLTWDAVAAGLTAQGFTTAAAVLHGRGGGADGSARRVIAKNATKQDKQVRPRAQTGLRAAPHPPCRARAQAIRSLAQHGCARRHSAGFSPPSPGGAAGGPARSPPGSEMSPFAAPTSVRVLRAGPSAPLTLPPADVGKASAKVRRRAAHAPPF